MTAAPPLGEPLPDPQPCGSCQATIIFVRTSKGGTMPLDPEPEDEPFRGAVVLHYDGEHGAWVGTVQTQASILPAAPFYRSHFATCPNAERHRRRTR